MTYLYFISDYVVYYVYQILKKITEIRWTVSVQIKLVQELSCILLFYKRK